MNYPNNNNILKYPQLDRMTGHLHSESFFVYNGFRSLDTNITYERPTRHLLYSKAVSTCQPFLELLCVVIGIKRYVER